MNIVTCGADNDFLNSVVRGIILEMVNEGTLQAQLLDCEGTPLGKNAKVLLCCEGDCGDNKPEDKDTFINNVTKEIVGGNYKITLARNDGQSFVIEIPVAPPPVTPPPGGSSGGTVKSVEMEDAPEAHGEGRVSDSAL